MDDKEKILDLADRLDKGYRDKNRALIITAPAVVEIVETLTDVASRMPSHIETTLRIKKKKDKNA